MATTLQPTNENLRRLRKFLRLGGLVAIPTETVYGLAANAFDAKACEKIFAAKGRPADDPLICHVASIDIANSIGHFNPLSLRLAETFWPGPLTLILPKKEKIPSIVTAGLDSVGVRSPKHPVFRDLIKEIDFPLAAPSANPFAYISPTRPEHVEANLGDRIEYILDGGPCELGVESTIIDTRDESRPTILRQGALTQEMIEKTLGIVLFGREDVAAEGPARAPGTAPKHYSPKGNLTLTASINSNEAAAHPETAYLVWKKPTRIDLDNLFWLSASGSLEEAASRLYAALREIDQRGFEQIIAETFPDEGLGLALNDRLKRAAAT